MSGGNQCPTSLWTFNDDQRRGQGHDQSVSRREMAGTGHVVWESFAEKKTRPSDGGLQIAMVAGINPVEMGAEHGDRRPILSQTAPVHRRINAFRKAVEHRPPRLCEGTTETIRHAQTMH